MSSPKTAVLFPGMNSLLKQGDRLRFLPLEEVRGRFAEGERIVEEKLGEAFSFEELLRSDTKEIYHLDRINRATILIVSLQVAVFERIKRNLPGDAWLVGCSLGDVARTVCSGALAFDEALRITKVSSIDKAGLDAIGENVAVFTRIADAFKDDDIRWMESLGLGVCHLSPSLLNVAGSYTALGQLRERAKEKRWKVLFLLEYPFHSQAIASYAEKFKPHLQELSLNEFNRPVFSSLFVRPLASAGEVREEQTYAFTHPHHWMRTIRTLRDKHGVNRFVNVGPCKTLWRLTKEIAPDCIVQDAEELL